MLRYGSYLLGVLSFDNWVNLQKRVDRSTPAFDRYYQCALVDASAKHKLLPLARVPGESATTLFTGKPRLRQGVS